MIYSTVDRQKSGLRKRQRRVPILAKRNAFCGNGRFSQDNGSQNYRVQDERQVLNNQFILEIFYLPIVVIFQILK